MTFQKLCLLSTESHKLDGWMVRFLLEHSLGLTKRNMPIIPQTLDIESDKCARILRSFVRDGVAAAGPSDPNNPAAAASATPTPPPVVPAPGDGR